jgi:hypothetical protein
VQQTFGTLSEADEGGTEDPFTLNIKENWLLRLDLFSKNLLEFVYKIVSKEKTNLRVIFPILQ